MANILIVNGHHPSAHSPGGLNAALTERAQARLTAMGHETRLTRVAAGYDSETEIDRHLWADAILYQFPVNSMGAPWLLKKYFDEIFTIGMDGRLSRGDGRTRATPGPEHYGMGGAMGPRRFMLSVTFNAPRAAFGDPANPFFEGMTVEDLMRPTHLTMKFAGLTPLPTFAVHDVRKNPTVKADFTRFDAHLDAHFPHAPA